MATKRIIETVGMTGLIYSDGTTEGIPEDHPRHPAQEAGSGGGGEELAKLNVVQLQEIARALEIRGRGSMRKAELIKAIERSRT